MTTAQIAQIKRISKKYIFKTSLLAIFVLLVGILIKVSPSLDSAQAQGEQNFVSLTAIPPRLGDDGTILVDPGERVQVQIRLRSDSDADVDLITYARDFIIDADGETPIEVESSVSNRWSLASWLTMAPTQHSISMGETIGINILIDVPEDALPGGHYAMILHQPATVGEDGEMELNETASAISQRVGTLLYVIVDGPINEEAYVRNFTFPPFSEYGPVPFSFTVENESDIHITPQIKVEIFNIFGQKVNEIVVESRNVFPLSSRDLSDQWNQVWGFGKYNAKLTMSFGSSGGLVIANTSFWLLPITIIIAAIILILTTIILILSVRKHIIHRREMEQKHIQDLEGKIQQLQGYNGQDSTQGDESQQQDETPTN